MLSSIFWTLLVLLVPALVYGALNVLIWPSTQRPSSLSRIDELESPTRARGIDIIFVHGLGASIRTTWGPLDGTCWVRDFLPYDIPEPFRKDVRIYFFTYDSDYRRGSAQARLRNFGENLLNYLDTEIRQTEVERTRDLMFVAHSYGGLVTKKALLCARSNPKYSNILDHTKAIFFLGTPHRGANIHFSALGSFFVNLLRPFGSNPAMLAEVCHDRTGLYDLQTDFENMLDERVRIVNFFELRKTGLNLGPFQYGSLVVDEDSATFARDERIGMNLNHSDLNKFKTRDRNYHFVLSHLLKSIQPPLLEKQNRFYSVPASISGKHVDRRGLSRKLSELLNKHQEGSSLPHALALHGLGGAGKSQLALKYAEDNKQRYDPIMWIDARDTESIRASFERCASELKLQLGQSQTQSSDLKHAIAVQAVLRWLQSRKATDEEWLVIIDNADDVALGIRDVIPSGGRGSVIITSQDKEAWMLVDGGCERLQVHTMEDTESRALLLRHLKLDADAVPRDVLEDCDKVAAELGHLALAIDLAGAYVANDDERSLKRYLTDYARHKDEMLQEKWFRGLRTTDKTVWTVWDTTLERIEKQYPELRPGLVLAFLSQFIGSVVQDELLRVASRHISMTCDRLYNGQIHMPDWLERLFTSSADQDDWDDYFYKQCRELLARYGLIQRSNGDWPGISMHSLVRWRAQKYEEHQPWGQWHLITVLAGCEEFGEDCTEPRFRRELVVHIPTMDPSLLDRLQVEDERKLFAWLQVRKVLIGQDRWKDVEKICLDHLEYLKTIFGEEHPATLSSTNYLALAYYHQARWKEVETLLLQVIETSRKALGEESSEYLLNLQSLAMTYSSQRRWQEAEAIELQLVAARKHKLGDEYRGILRCMRRLARTYTALGRSKEAEALLTQSIHALKRVLGDTYPETMSDMRRLAAIYNTQERCKEAEDVLLQVANNQTTILGPEHPDTLHTLTELAMTYLKQDRDHEAEQLALQVVEISKSVLGPEHPNTLQHQYQLALTYCRQQRWAEAEQLQVQMWESSKKAFGEEHPKTLITMNSLGLIYRSQKRWEEAEVLQLRAWEGFKKVFGIEHPTALATMHDVACLRSAQGRGDEAIALMEECVQLRDKVLGSGHSETADSISLVNQWRATKDDTRS
ncbi:TPR-like protein [Myriangium duriaei CBS 260.36]|uniref:GPI inositol-deacylase n=1 Tax=Myriangium duriaei CBS 260.36 TaxID=1168546 RepID=A0A9P4MFJ5_9PEZI|nr:TPR-like protein [Myriangium duriaei CBS 260.36]